MTSQKNQTKMPNDGPQETINCEECDQLFTSERALSVH